MPVSLTSHGSPMRWRWFLAAVVVASAVVGPASAQPKPAEPPADGVVLSPAEYKALLEQAEQLKKLKEAAKPVAPSGVAVRGKVVARGERTVAALTATFAFRTTQPRALVTLGCQRAAVLTAKIDGGKLPPLSETDGGLTVLVEAAGEHTVVLDLEVAVTGRGAKGVGFDFGLPRAAVSTLTLDAAPAGAKKLSVGTRGPDTGLLPRPAEIRREAVPADQLVGQAFPLGPTDTLEVTWEPPAVAAADTALTAESDVAVRVDETQVEAVAKVRLRGAAREWPIATPVNAEVTVERTAGAVAGGTDEPTVVRPTDPNKPVWTVRTAADTGPVDWTVTILVRQLRSKPGDGKFRGPYPVGPFTPAANVRHSGRVAVSAPPAVRVGFKPLPELRRQDLPPGAPDDLLAAFAFAAAPANRTAAWLELDARPAAATARVRPTHKLRLTNAGWKLETTVRVTPPPRLELEQLTVELPGGWQGVELSPPELVEPVQVVGENGEARTLAVRLAAPQKAAFEFTLSATYPLPKDPAASLPLPRFPQADERDARLTATVPDGFEVTGSGFARRNGQPVADGEPLKATARNAVAAPAGEFEGGLARVDLAWQPVRPDVACDGRAEVTVTDRQLVVTQTLVFRPADADPRPVKVRGPANAVGLKSSPPLDPLRPGEWEFAPPEPGKEFTLTASFAVRLPPRAEGGTPVPVGLLWAEAAARQGMAVRVWGGGGGRAVRFEGDWRELPPEPAADRDALPWFTLAAGGPTPLTIVVGEGGEAGVAVERAAIQATLSDDGTAAVRGRFVLRRWPTAGADLLLPRDAGAEVYLDGKRVEAAPQAATGGADDSLRLPLPDPRPGRPPVLVEVRYRAATATDRGGWAVRPPVLASATYAAPVRWSVVGPPGLVLLGGSPATPPDLAWRWTGWGVGPVAAASAADLDRWLADGTDADTGDAAGTFAGHQAAPAPLRFTVVPRVWWTVAASVLGGVLLLALSRLRPVLLGPAVALVAVAGAACGVLAPQPTAELLAAAQPGLLLAAVAVGGWAAWKAVRRWQADRVPGFSRAAPPSVAPSPASTSAAVVVPSVETGEWGTGEPPSKPSSRGPSAVVSLDPSRPAAPAGSGAA